MSFTIKSVLTAMYMELTANDMKSQDDERFRYSDDFWNISNFD